MLLLDLTLRDAAANVALDEALLDEAEAYGAPQEILRLWEPAAPLVVVGRSSKPDIEVDLEACNRLRIPVIRRTSGGAAIVTGPGCLMYAVILSYELRPDLKSIDKAHCFVLDRLVRGLTKLAPVAARCGTSDLTMSATAASENATAGGTALRKFSGNSLRAKRKHLLYHGTLLYDFDLALVERCLRHPPREPSYRGGRRHADFIANLTVECEQLRSALITAWDATESLADWPQARTAELVASKYAQAGWNQDGSMSAP